MRIGFIRFIEFIGLVGFIGFRGFTHGPLSSSFLGLPCRILNVNHRQELLRGLWVEGL